MPKTRPYNLRLLGRVELTNAEGRAVALPTRKTALLLAMLALAGDEAQTRGPLAAAVWEGVGPHGSRESLRTALSALRKALPEGAIQAEGDRLALMRDTVLVTLDRAEEGEFMPGFENDWVVERRLGLRSRFVAEALTAAHRDEAERRDEAALEGAERACALDPLDTGAAAMRRRLLLRVGRAADAVTFGDAYRVRFVRELGILPEGETNSPPTSENPLVAAVEWTLAREPEAACSLLAATQSQWFTLSVERALEVHRRVLASTERPSRDRGAVAAGVVLFGAMVDPLSVRSGELEGLYRESLSAGDLRASMPLCEALAYGSLSAGDYAKAVAYAKEGADAALRGGDAAEIGQWGLHRGIIEFHMGDAESCYRRVDDAIRLMEDSGSAFALLSAHSAQIGFWTHRGWLDRAAERLDAQRRRIAAYGSERMGAWVHEMEGLLHERMGDLARARESYERFRERAPAGGQCAVAAADDGLVRVNCGLREYDVAADALARNVVYRRRKGSVASRFERSTNAPAVRQLRERVGEADMATAFQRAASVA